MDIKITGMQQIIQGFKNVFFRNQIHKLTVLGGALFFVFQIRLFAAGTPHTLMGQVHIPGYGAPVNGSVTFNCYLADYTGSPGDTLHETSLDCGYQDGQYWVSVHNFEDPWAAGMVIHIDITDASGGSAFGECTLTNNASDILDLVLNGSSLADTSYVLVQVKTCIEGAYQTGDLMRTDLNSEGFLPLTSPYTDGRTASAIPSGAVDWIFVELRETPSAAAVAFRSFFLRNDGMLTDLDGVTTNLQFDEVEQGYYYIVVKHRSHLDIMSANSVYLGP